MRILLIRMFSLILLHSLACVSLGVCGEEVDPQKSEQLATIQRNMKWLRSEIEQRKKKQALAKKSEYEDLQEEVDDLEGRLQRARLTFVSVVADVELPSPEEKGKPKKRDMVQEALQLIEPLFDTVRRVSEKPRRVEAYRTQIYYTRERVAQIEKALSNLRVAAGKKEFESFADELQGSLLTLAHDRDELQVQLNGVERRLSYELEDNRTVGQVLKESAEKFAKSKGKDILIAAVVFYLVLIGLLFLRRPVFRLKVIQNRIQELGKAFSVGYSFLSLLLASLAMIVALNLLNDWFLVTIVTLVLLGIGWAIRTVMRLFAYETRLILNLGPVKEGERVIWGGVPWRVSELNFRSTLVNDALQGGTISLPAAAIASMLSRPLVPGESWFPTQVGDFVQLDDGAYGQVKVQTPEMVVLQIGKTTKQYATSAFLARNPQNFSTGFDVSTEMNIRCSGKLPPTDELQAALTRSVLARMQGRLGGQAPELNSLDLQVFRSGQSMIRIRVTADASGRVAGQRDSLKRELYAAVGEAWNEIPN